MPVEAPGTKLYLITDRELTGEEGLVRSIRAALEGGVRFIQLREKGLSARGLLELARELRRVTGDYGARLLINDRADIALLSGADGVHLGQKGVSAKEARRMLGKDGLIGVSAHGLDEARRAWEDGADFITLGPVYFTPSKAGYGKPAGVDAIREVKKALDIPVYAIGGIKKEHIKEVLQAGADGAAVISAILGAPDIKKSAAEILEELSSI